MDNIGSETLKRMDKAHFYNDVIFGMAQKHMKGEILEIGSGIGSFTKKLANCGSVTTIDIEKYYVSKMKKLLKKVANVGIGDIEKGEYFFDNNKRFNSIICLNVLEHIKNDSQALKNMYKLLKKGGKVFLLTPAHSLLYGSLDKNLGHERRYGLNDLSTKFLEAGFEVQSKYYFNIFGAFGWFLNSRIIRRKIIPSNQLRVFVAFSRITLFFEKFMTPPFGLSCVIVAQK